MHRIKTGATSLLPNAKFDLYQVVGNADYTTSDETAESDDVRMNSTKAGGENHISTDNNGKIQLSALSAETYYYNSGKVDLKPVSLLNILLQMETIRIISTTGKKWIQITYTRLIQQMD